MCGNSHLQFSSVYTSSIRLYKSQNVSTRNHIKHDVLITAYLYVISLQFVVSILKGEAVMCLTTPLGINKVFLILIRIRQNKSVFCALARSKDYSRCEHVYRRFKMTQEYLHLFICFNRVQKHWTEQKHLHYSKGWKADLLNPRKWTLLGIALLLSMQSNATEWNSNGCWRINKNLVNMHTQGQPNGSLWQDLFQSHLAWYWE